MSAVALTRTARVAPERRIHHPLAAALPVVILGEDSMTKKLTYAEQLRHPNWQRKRLEVLSEYGFKCCACGTAEKMLHVHHKQYIKGREVWDYPAEMLEVLCEDCHKDTHRAKERIDAILGQLPSHLWHSIADLLIGYVCEELIDPGFWCEVDGQATQARAGQLAFHMSNFQPKEIHEIVDCFLQLGPQSFLEALRAEVAKEHNLIDEFRASKEGDGEA